MVVRPDETHTKAETMDINFTCRDLPAPKWTRVINLLKVSEGEDEGMKERKKNTCSVDVMINAV